MIFTDENDEKFELFVHDDGVKLNPEYKIIRPIPLKPKRYSINLFVLDEEPVDDEAPARISELHYETDTEDQANLIKEAVEETLKWVFSDHATVYGINSTGVEKWLAVRQSMRENN